MLQLAFHQKSYFMVGKYVCLLFHGREIRMPLNAWKDQPSSVTIKPMEKEKVTKHATFKQELSKVYTDKKRDANYGRLLRQN